MGEIELLDCFCTFFQGDECRFKVAGMISMWRWLFYVGTQQRTPNTAVSFSTEELTKEIIYGIVSCQNVTSPLLVHCRRKYRTKPRKASANG